MVANVDEFDLENCDKDALFHLGIRFYRGLLYFDFLEKKLGKAVNLTYQDNLKLMSLVKQGLHGPFDSKTAPPLGYFDLLGDMSKEKAKEEYLSILKDKCPTFLPYIAANSLFLSTKNSYKESQYNGIADEPLESRFLDENNDTPKTNGLNCQDMTMVYSDNAYFTQQIFPQIQAYAATLYPNNEMHQKLLIDHLSAQFFQNLQLLNNNSNNSSETPNSIPAKSESQNIESNSNKTADLANGHSSHYVNESLNMNNSDNTKVKDNLDENQHTTFLQTDGIENVVTYKVGGAIEPATIWFKTDDLKSFKKDVKQNHAECMLKIGHGETVTIRVPTHSNGSALFWEFATDSYDIGFGVFFEWCTPYTDKISVYISESTTASEEDEEFDIEDVDDDEHHLSKENALPVVQNNISTPEYNVSEDPEMGLPAKTSNAFLGSHNTTTHHNNKNIMKSNKQNHYSIAQSQHLNEDYSRTSSPSTLSHTSLVSPDKINSNDDHPKNENPTNLPLIDVIVPLERRDCHVKICAGSHPYPGQGVYSLKFDNSYSLWRSKWLYYKIYYTK